MMSIKNILCVLSVLLGISVYMSSATEAARDYKDVFEALDLSRPGLEKVRAEYERGRWNKASEALLDYFRTRQGVYIPGQDSKTASEKDMLWADDALKHTFHVLETPVWNYGKNIDWEYWPVKDIEMRVQLHRHGWWTSLGRAYHTTGDGKYAREYVMEFRDWVKKNPCKSFEIDQHGTVSSGTIDVNSPNECFAWRPLEVGIRLLRWSTQFSLFLDSKQFSPEFLLEFLRSYHQNAEFLMQNFSPSGNHVIHQSQGIVRAGACFPEFKQADSWLKAGFDNLNREIVRQSLPDGCHFELDPGYHIGFVESFLSAIKVAKNNGKTKLVPSSCLEQIDRMINYYFDYCYPDGTHPCFSDARRYDDLADPEMFRPTPAYKSSGHPDSGFYTLRSGWSSDDIIMPIKATKRGMWHAQPDFGTFELWAFGKKLMPDAGAYTYSGDEEIERQRAYFKATARHNALTLDNRNYDDPLPKVLVWRPQADSAGVQLLSVQHEAYKGLTRCRSIAFVKETFFVVTDEVWGPATGHLTLRNCLGSGSVVKVEAESETGAVVEGTANPESAGKFVYKDGNVGLSILVAGPKGSKISMEKDWYSEAMHEKSERLVILLDVPRTADSGVQRFVTIIYPFTGEQIPETTQILKEYEKIIFCGFCCPRNAFRLRP